MGRRMGNTQEAGYLGTTVRRSTYAIGLALVVWVVTLLGAAEAPAHPLISVSCSPAPEDCSRWYRSDVKVVWTVIAEHQDFPLKGVEGCGETQTVVETHPLSRAPRLRSCQSRHYPREPWPLQHALSSSVRRWR